MTPEPHDFPELKKLLALKRHEAPPPGYFQNFSAKVIARIESEAAATARPWWRRVFAELDLRPAVACAYALVIGGVLVAGLGIALDRPPETAAQMELPAPGHPLLAAQPAVAAEPAQPQLTLQPMALPGQEPSAMGAVLNPDSAPSGLFRTDGFFGAGGVPDQSPAALNFRR